MGLKIFEVTRPTVYNPNAPQNTNIAPNGLKFITIEIDDVILPGEEFTITLSSDDQILELENKMYILLDEFYAPDGVSVNNQGQHITPFFVSFRVKEFNTVKYTCVKFANSYLTLVGNFSTRLL